MVDVARGLRENHHISRFRSILNSDTRHKIGELIVLLLSPFLERVIVAARTRQSLPEKRLGYILSQINGVFMQREIVESSILAAAAGTGEDFTSELIPRLVLLYAVANPWVIAGILLLLGFFASYLTALSWADLTFVLPSTALGYVVVALLSRFWLHEQISLSRWLGIALITIGVGFVTRGPAYTA